MSIQTARAHIDITFMTLSHFLPYLSASMPKGIARNKPTRQSLALNDHSVVSRRLVCVPQGDDG